MNEPRSFELLDPKLRPTCEAILSAASIPGASVAVVVNDKTHHYSYGVKSVGTASQVTVDTGFNIGSCSKAFVSAMASLAPRTAPDPFSSKTTP